ncbi:MAG TPA: hypothetical protein VF383_02015 [Candidatus Dormibacteraeota bacterium]
MPGLVQLNYVLVALSVALLLVAAFEVATGKSPIPARIAARLTQVTASPRDERWQGAAGVLIAIGLLAQAASYGVRDGRGHGLSFLQLGALAVYTGCLFASLVITTARVRRLDRRDGTIGTAWERLNR